MPTNDDNFTQPGSGSTKDDSLTNLELTLVNPHFSTVPLERKMAEAKTKISRLERYEQDDLRKLLIEGKSVEEAVAILKENRRRKVKGPGER